MENTATVSAPYAEIAIPLYLGSLTGSRYRSLNCMECGQEFLQRDSERMYRVGDNTLPAEINISSESVKAKCGKCNQWYGVQVSLTVTSQEGGIPLYLQPQSVYFSVETHKHLRYLHCLECGKTFQSISDRINYVADNRIPFEQLNPERLGPFEQPCTWNRCGQIWALMV